MATGPILHVVIIVKENHSFDNYFGRYPGVEGDATLAHAPNPPPSDPRHDHAAWLTRATTAARQQYDQADIPAYWALAQQYTLCDHYFTDVAGPSTPNHLMLVAADATVINNPPRNPPPLYTFPALPDRLTAAGLTWGNYGGYALEYIKSTKGHLRPNTQFLADLTAGKLPAVSWLYASSTLSEHPVGNVTKGSQWTLDQINAVVRAGLWPHVAIFVTWDDWGGWADHVNPPLLERWTDGTQFRLGTRVGCLVVSPYARKGHVSKVRHSHVSLVKFCEKNFGLPSLNARTAAADDLSDCFDLTQTPLPPPR